MIELSLQLKLIAIFEIFSISAVGVYFPHYILEQANSKKGDDNNNNDDYNDEDVVSAVADSHRVLTETLTFRGLKCFSGGLVVAVAFCHLLQDSIVALNENCLVKDITPPLYPLAMSLAMSGVIFLVCLEQMTLVAIDMVDNYEIQSTNNILSNNYNNYYSILSQQDDEGEVVIIADTHSQYQYPKDHLRPIGSTSISTSSHLDSNNYIIIKSIENQVFKKQLFKLIIFECSVALHSVIIGFNLGILSTDNLPKIKTLMIGLGFHQFFEGFSLGTMIIDIQKLSWNMNILFILAYALTAPIGIVIGILTSNTTTSDYMNGIVNGFAGGFLIYAGLVEILYEEFKKETSSKKVSIQQRPVMCMSMILGAAFMAILAIWT
jgi:zinc transporter ZupT